MFDIYSACEVLLHNLLILIESVEENPYGMKLLWSTSNMFINIRVSTHNQYLNHCCLVIVRV